MTEPARIPQVNLYPLGYGKPKELLLNNEIASGEKILSGISTGIRLSDSFLRVPPGLAVCVECIPSGGTPSSPTMQAIVEVWDAAVPSGGYTLVQDPEGTQILTEGAITPANPRKFIVTGVREFAKVWISVTSGFAPAGSQWDVRINLVVPLGSIGTSQAVAVPGTAAGGVPQTPGSNTGGAAYATVEQGAGTAGAPYGGVETVQGILNGYPVNVLPAMSYFQGTIGLTATNAGSSPLLQINRNQYSPAAIDLEDIRLALITLYNNATQAVTAGSLKAIDTGLVTGLKQTLTHPLQQPGQATPGSGVISVAATTGIGTFIVPLPKGTPLSQLQLSISMAAATTGSVDYGIALQEESSTLISNLPPVSVSLPFTTADSQVIAAPAAGQSLYVRGVSAGNSSATLSTVSLKEGSGGRVGWSAPLAASGSNAIDKFTGFWQLPAATGLFASMSAAVTAVIVNVTDWLIGPA